MSIKRIPLLKCAKKTGTLGKTTHWRWMTCVLLLSTKLDIASIISDKPHLTEVFDCSSQKLGEHQSWVWKVSSVPQQTQITLTVISNPELLFWKTTAAVHVAWASNIIQRDFEDHSRHSRSVTFLLRGSLRVECQVMPNPLNASWCYQVAVGEDILA